jgi:hypothetical protein
VKFSGRLGELARAVPRSGFVRARDRRAAASAPIAVYANILDGARLWLALDRQAGVPALRHVDTGELIRPENDLPPGHADHEPDYRSVRWALDDALPVVDQAVCEVVALPSGDGVPRPVRVEELSREYADLHPTTADGAWKFRLERTPPGILRVRRVRAPQVARVLHAAFVDRCAVITCESLGRGSADLLVMDRDGRLAARLPMRRTSLGFERVVSEEDVPTEPMRYRLMFGSEEEHVPIARRRNDLAMAEAATVLMPLVVSRDSDIVVARVRYAPDGTLLLARLDPAEAQA